ncbi:MULTISPECIES: hypothetical protein [unclassified Micromonospora]|uniref:hypothetical protein n=1 Tax=unclassified Micromonospora TaxID=2617518 RepID=UPI001C23E52B|nr:MULTISPECIES: hypothetical protein [unclassified Micromonospora]MBU8859815.1 hypothetical protein [Micromonospora sp. WMMB482]MDM4779337.1 hypothetical protein [Micromonospora sp. b486]
MPRAPLLLILAAVSAVAHVVGVLVAAPLWRGAEVLGLALLLAYAVAAGLPAPRWAVPAALVPLLVDAARTMPAEPGAGEFGWVVYGSGDSAFDSTAGFDAAFAGSWAALVAVAVLLVAFRGRGRRRHLIAAAVAAAPVVGYAAVRVTGIGTAVAASTRVVEVRTESTLTRVGGPGHDQADVVPALVLAVLPPLALALAALALAVLLAGRGRRLAATGAALLAMLALPLLDAAIEAVPLPYSVDSTALFAWYAVTPTRMLPQPVPALVAVVELSAYLLLVAGLTRSHRAAVPAPAAAG